MPLRNGIYRVAFQSTSPKFTPSLMTSLVHVNRNRPPFVVREFKLKTIVGHGRVRYVVETEANPLPLVFFLRGVGYRKTAVPSSCHQFVAVDFGRR